MLIDGPNSGCFAHQHPLQTYRRTTVARLRIERLNLRHQLAPWNHDLHLRKKLRSPDGKSIVFGGTNDFMGKDSSSRELHIVQLANGAVQPVPGSNGLFSPRWSPDGRYIAALSLDQRQVRLYTVATQSWRTLNLSSGADPIWSSDSHYLFLHASLSPTQPIDRVSIPDGHVDEITRLADSRRNDAVDFVFGGLTPANQLLIRARVFTANFYSLELK